MELFKIDILIKMKKWIIKIEHFITEKMFEMDYFFLHVNKINCLKKS